MTDERHSSNWPLALLNLGIVALAGSALWFTHSLWSFLVLLFLFSTGPSTMNAKCPKCDHEFVATAKDNEEN